MKISILIATYNGAEKISKVLSALQKQIEPVFEVLVLVDGSTDDTVGVLNGFRGMKHLRVLQQENGGRAKVRNFGAKAAQGDLLIFFDDDMRPEPDCVGIHKAHHLQYPDSILTGAQIDWTEDDFPDIRKYRAFLTRKWAGEIAVAIGEPMLQGNLFLTAANFSIPRKLFEQLGGFDERLSDAEDYELAVRANEKGIKLYYNHQAFAWHEDRIDIKRYIKRLRQYTLAQQKLNQLNPSLQNKYTVAAPSGLKGLFFRFFNARFWLKSIDMDIWPKLLPQKMRYRLYDWIITANGVYYPESVQLD